MRFIPFKVICLPDMDDGTYPRRLAPPGLDSMSQKPIQNDRSRRGDDRYLFLEVLISVQRALCISYIDRSIQDSNERFPSVLVQGLMDYIGQGRYPPSNKSLACDQNEARVKTHITRLHTHIPFDAQSYLPGEQQGHARK